MENLGTIFFFFFLIRIRGVEQNLDGQRGKDDFV